MLEFIQAMDGLRLDIVMLLAMAIVLMPTLVGERLRGKPFRFSLRTMLTAMTFLAVALIVAVYAFRR